MRYAFFFPKHALALGEGITVRLAPVEEHQGLLLKRERLHESADTSSASGNIGDGPLSLHSIVNAQRGAVVGAKIKLGRIVIRRP